MKYSSEDIIVIYGADIQINSLPTVCSRRILYDTTGLIYCWKTRRKKTFN